VRERLERGLASNRAAELLPRDRDHVLMLVRVLLDVRAAELLPRDRSDGARPATESQANPPRTRIGGTRSTTGHALRENAE
jgi:hypothetical protein